MPAPELIAFTYPWLKPLHVALVVLSVSLFTTRGLAVLGGQAWPMRSWARALGPAIDTLLLSSGAVLWWLLQLNPLQDHWLGAKLVLLVVYVGLGTAALKRARTVAGRSLLLAAALALVVFMASVALGHHPAGLWAP
jgi:uncharacterized membrane protein SirB2